MSRPTLKIHLVNCQRENVNISMEMNSCYRNIQHPLRALSGPFVLLVKAFETGTQQGSANAEM